MQILEVIKNLSKEDFLKYVFADWLSNPVFPVDIFDEVNQCKIKEYNVEILKIFEGVGADDDKLGCAINSKENISEKIETQMIEEFKKLNNEVLHKNEVEYLYYKYPKDSLLERKYVGKELTLTSDERWELMRSASSGRKQMIDDIYNLDHELYHSYSGDRQVDLKEGTFLKAYKDLVKDDEQTKDVTEDEIIDSFGKAVLYKIPCYEIEYKYKGKIYNFGGFATGNRKLQPIFFDTLSYHVYMFKYDLHANDFENCKNTFRAMKPNGLFENLKKQFEIKKFIKKLNLFLCVNGCPKLSKSEESNIKNVKNNMYRSLDSEWRKLKH